MVGELLGVSHTQVGRVEHGRAEHVALIDLMRHGAVVGLDLSLRAFPGGPPIRDAGHLALLERFRACLHPSLRWRTEVPIPIVGDQRAWDGWIIGAGDIIGVEAEMRLVDAQAVERRIGLKQRDSNVARVVLLLNDSERNRLAVRANYEQLMARFPVPGRELLAALRAGRDPGGSGIVFR